MARCKGVIVPQQCIYSVGVERLYTPWRRAFIEGAAANADSGCFLCTTPAADDDPRTLIVHRAERVFVILNRYPYNSGHVLVAPYTHTGDFAALDASTAADLMHMAQRTVAILHDVYQPHAFNLGLNLGRTAGRGVLVLEDADGQLCEIAMQPGLGYHVSVGQRHRLCAAPDEDAVVFEASTPEVGTTLRLEDDYARSDETEQMRQAERASLVVD